MASELRPETALPLAATQSPQGQDLARPEESVGVEQGEGFPSGRRVRARLARLTAAKAGGTPPVLEPLSRTIRASHPKADQRAVVRAYAVAEQCHEGQKRRSGDPYITHPLACLLYTSPSPRDS